MWVQEMMKISKPAVFLDRDGVVTEERGYVVSIDNLCIFPYVAKCIDQIHQKGYYAIVITNQSGVARGLFTEKELKKMNKHLIKQTNVDAVYYCPHHPKGVEKRYRMVCHCRKPETGMFETACSEFNIDIKNSYMVGDRAGDIVAGQNIGIRTVLLESGYGTSNLEENVRPDYVFTDLRDIIKIL